MRMSPRGEDRSVQGARSARCPPAGRGLPQPLCLRDEAPPVLRSRWLRCPRRRSRDPPDPGPAGRRTRGPPPAPHPPPPPPPPPPRPPPPPLAPPPPPPPT